VTHALEHYGALDFSSVFFFETMSHVLVTALPRDGSGMVTVKERNKHGHVIKTTKGLFLWDTKLYKIIYRPILKFFYN
jgi:hypothetical protein